MHRAKSLLAFALTATAALLTVSGGAASAGDQRSLPNNSASTIGANDPASSSNLLLEPNPDPVGTDAEQLASDVGISVDDARTAIDRQEAVGALLQALSTDQDFGGLYVDYRPYSIVVLAAEGGGDHVAQETGRLSASQLTPYIRIVETPFTESVLSQTRADIVHLDSDDTITTSDIDLSAGTVLLSAASESDVVRVRQLVDSANLPIPASRVLVSVGGFENNTASFGGIRLDYPDGSYCTTGFSVTQISGSTDGVTSAAHCPNNNASEGSTGLNFQAGFWGGDLDVQWFTTPGLSDDNRVADAVGTRDITGRTSRGSMFNGENVCHYGAHSGYGCGQIASTSFDPGNFDNHTYNATFIRVTNDTTIVVSGSGTAT